MKPIDDAIHLAVGGVVARTLRVAGVKTLLGCSDWLAWGPCSSNPIKHQKLRTALWGKPDDGRSFGLAALSLGLNKARLKSPRPIVVWTADSWSDRISLLWLFAAAVSAGDPRGMAVYLADVRTTHEASTRSGYGRSHPLGLNMPRALIDCGSRAKPIAWPIIQAGAELWRLYASDDPRGFDSARRRGFPMLPLLRSASNSYGVLFPRLVGGGVRPSLIDSALLRAFVDRRGKKWCTLGHVFKWIMSNSGHLLTALGGTNWMNYRLEMWAAQQPQLVELRATEVPDTGRPSYRLTDLGMAAAHNSELAASVMPPLWVGGCQVYDPGKRWARRRTDGGWKVVRV